jgi:hypothetical protein
MVGYLRNRLEGGTYFFTVTLADRQSTALIDHIDALRKAFRVSRQQRPFTIEAIVILPEHLHAILNSRALAPDQRMVQHALVGCGHQDRAPSQWRACTLAKTLLGTHHPRRPRFRTARGLYSFQSGETSAGSSRTRLAAFLVSSLRAAWLAAERLGRECQRGHVIIRRESLILPQPALSCAHSGPRRMPFRSSGLRSCVWPPGYRYAHPGYIVACAISCARSTLP